MKYYSPANLSENIAMTPEGFLVCLGVPIARAGDLLYAQSETPITPGAGATVISRTIDDIHNADTIASFEGKPVTLNHPMGGDFVTPENWKHLAVGTVQNVRPGEGEDADKLLADLVITDSAAIIAVQSKALREVSCGYEAEFIELAPGRGRQTNIIGNHVALVAAGRCGSECAINDHVHNGGKSMTLKDKIMAMFGKVLDDAGLPAESAAPVTPVTPVTPVVTDAKAVADGLTSLTQKVEDEVAKMGTRFATIESALAKLLGLESLEAAKVGDQAAKTDEGTAPVMCTDAETIARAEILAPGIVKTKDVARKALDAAMANEEVKALLTPLLRGKALDACSADEIELLFVSGAELVRASRREALTHRTTLDALPTMQAGAMTPEKINAKNAERYK